jgi:Fur family peroxide stress response transcriptional regulator
MAVIKFSRQRQSIIDYLMQTKEHPTAEMVYRHVREQYPNISLGTVYRNLNLLVSQGKVRRLACGDGIDRFDGDTTLHNHFICSHCGCVMDLDMESFDHINTLAAARFPGKIEGNVTYFYGICPDCLLLEQKNGIAEKQIGNSQNAPLPVP